MPEDYGKRPVLPVRRSGSWLAIFLAGLLSIAVAVTLSFLTLGAFGPVLLLIGGVIFGLTAFHYFVWGWWLRKALRREYEADAEEP